MQERSTFTMCSPYKRFEYKKLSFVLVLCLNLFVLNAQYKGDINTPNPGEYISMDSAQKFVGMWMWSNGNDTLKIRFKKEKIFDGKFYLDRLFGFHQYIRNGFEIESSMKDSSHNFYQSGWSILAGVSRDCINCDTITGKIRDLTLKKRLDVKMILASNRTQLSFYTKDVELEMAQNYISGYTLPRRITLIKQ